METLDAATWQHRAAAHAVRVDRWLTPHLARRRAGERHPVEDFLFTYYSYRPAALRHWHPGFGVALADAPSYLSHKGYAAPPERGDAATVPVAYVVAHRGLLRGLRNLLTATAARTARLGCFGMHEWAMVYGLDQDRVRHSDWPLRLGRDGTDAVVTEHTIACSHFDAFRFFTDDARPLNRLRPSRDDRAAFEQPGCLHAGMDLYKHSYRISPMVASELVADCFELARDIRVLDMRASPYDLRALGYEPVRVETSEGKQEYVAAQRAFSERSRPLRARLIEECDRLLSEAA
ncbi:MAG TPA: 3-methyladenine DNA glycosylase [Nocardioidaceae bacterium]|nr:3-methyladenine DNA glycosylase [Nocardioidaceae bacterium]